MVSGRYISIWLLSLLSACSEDAPCIKRITTGKQTFYLQTKHWGVTGGARLFIISNDSTPIRVGEENYRVDYIFKGYYPIYLHTNGDTVLVYTSVKAPVPRDFVGSGFIRQIEIDNRLNKRFEQAGRYTEVDDICR